MTCQWSWIHFLWIVLPLTFAILVWMRLSQQKEAFLSTDDTQTIIQTYKQILNRSPTSTELSKHITEIDRKEYSIYELEIRLYNSDEYKRLIKTQDNGLSPELSRMIEEKEVIQYIRDLYTKERRKKPETDTLLPLKDLLIYFDYNPYKFVAMLRDKKYPDFEKEFLSTKKLSKDTLLDIYKRYFDDFQITRDADAIRAKETIAPLGKKFKSTMRTGTATSGGILGLTDTDKSQLVNFLVEKGFSRLQGQTQSGMNADGSYTESSYYTTKPVSSSSSGSCANTRYYLTPEDTIKSKGTGFSVGKHPPICVPVGVKHPVSPVVFGDLLGTNLDEAKDTQVGSIMPKFEYKEYIEVPTQCTDSSKGKTVTKKQTSSSSTTWQKVPPSYSQPPTQTSPSPKQYSADIQKYDAVLKPALEAFARWKNEMNTMTFLTEMASSTNAKAFFKKYPYMVDVLALYVYDKSERASLNQIAVMEYYSDIGYYTNPEYRYGTDNTHFSTYMTLSYFNQFYTNNRAVIDECIKLKTCLTTDPTPTTALTTTPTTTTPSTPTTAPTTTPSTTTPTTTAPIQYSPDVQKYKELFIITIDTISKNKSELEKPSFLTDLDSTTNPKNFLQKYPFMIDILKFIAFVIPRIDTLPENETNELDKELIKIAQEKGVDRLFEQIIVNIMFFYIKHQTIFDACLQNNSCLTSTTSTVEAFSNRGWYGLF